MCQWRGSPGGKRKVLLLRLRPPPPRTAAHPGGGDGRVRDLQGQVSGSQTPLSGDSQGALRQPESAEQIARWIG